MGTAERRLEILKYLCKHRQATMPQLAKMFGVSVRTIQRDIFELEETLRVPLEMRSGKYGGVFVKGDYTFDRAYMHEEQTALLWKIYTLVEDRLPAKEIEAFARLIQAYTKPA